MQRVPEYGTVFLAGAAAALSMSFATGNNSPEWDLAYAHDANGNTLEGSKADLIEAVREGRPVRIYWGGRRVEHVTDSYFLTVLDGEVFAQTPIIRGQRPAINPARIDFAPDGVTWNTIHATNGSRALRWFVHR